MSPKGRSILAGISGFFAGALVASMVPWSPLPKSILAVIVAVLISTLFWAVLRPGTATDSGW